MVLPQNTTAWAVHIGQTFISHGPGVWKPRSGWQHLVWTFSVLVIRMVENLSDEVLGPANLTGLEKDYYHNF